MRRLTSEMNNGSANQISRHVPRMYRVAYRLLADADKANDVVQDACVKALANLSGFTGQSSLATWLHRITVNCAKDVIRSTSRKDDVYSVMRPVDRSQGVSPAETAETHELSELAWGLLQELPEESRSAFALTQLDGYSYDEAAEIENEPRGTIASRVFRAKSMLLERMNAHTHGRART